MKEEQEYKKKRKRKKNSGGTLATSINVHAQQHDEVDIAEYQTATEWSSISLEGQWKYRVLSNKKIVFFRKKQNDCGNIGED